MAGGSSTSTEASRGTHVTSLYGRQEPLQACSAADGGSFAVTMVSKVDFCTTIARDHAAGRKGHGVSAFRNVALLPLRTKTWLHASTMRCCAA